MSSSKSRLSDLPTRPATGPDEIVNAPSHPRSGLRAELDDDLLSRLRDEHLLVSMEMQAALDICRNSAHRPAATPRELAPQFEWLAANPVLTSTSSYSLSQATTSFLCPFFRTKISRFLVPTRETL